MQHFGRSLAARLASLMLAAGLSTVAAEAWSQSLTPLANAVQTVSGESHSCALTNAGAVLCWGRNAEGQLGDGSVETRATAVAVSGLSAGVTAIAAGAFHTCAVTNAGAVLCWGRNTNGQLGDDTTTQRQTPVTVSGLSSFIITAVTAGETHTCARTIAGTAMCWGGNASGQLGDNTTTQRLTPVPVSGLPSVAAITAGSNHSCAVTSASGAALCWGGNGSGQLGDSSTTQRLTPVQVTGLFNGIAGISAGFFFTCAVSTTGAATCWGSNPNGQLGDGSTSNRTAPVAVSGLSSSVTSISAGTSHACARTSAGAALCWGFNLYGELGDGSTAQRATPAMVTGLSSGVAMVASGWRHTCAVTSGGAVQCWGSNDFARLGDGSNATRFSPTAISGLSAGVAAIDAGARHTCARTSAGAALCWGSNNGGQLGDGSTTQRLTSVPVSGLTSGVTTVSAGGEHSCAVTSAGAAMCWGTNANGQLGDGSTTQRLTPVVVSGLSSGVAAISAGNFHTCARTTSGAALCWGRNFNGQIGDGTAIQRLTPVAVSGLPSGVSSISAGQSFSCGVNSAGGAMCWGSNGAGQLGDGTLTQRLAPVAVTGLASGVAAIGAGSNQTCALTSAGAMRCWGANTEGQLGNGTTSGSSTPVAVSGLSSGVAIIAMGGFATTCAVTSAGAGLCWGDNYYGQIGDGTTSRRLTPTPVIGLSSGTIDLSGGSQHTCSVTGAGAVLCWGSNSNGQLGIGGRDGRAPAFVQVLLTDVILATGFE